MISAKIRKVGGRIAIYTILIIAAFICAGPFLWLISTSFKTSENIYMLNWIPKHPGIDNYISVFKMLDIGKMLINSVIIAVGGVSINVLFASLCAYPLAKMEFYGKKFINSLLIATMIIPAAAGLVVNYVTIQRMGLGGNFLGVIIPNSVNVFSIILLRQAYLAIPKDMMESARIEGASELLTWRRIMLPQIMPSIVTVLIMDFINKWNMFLWPLLILKVDQYPVATGLKHLSGSLQYKFTNVAAGTVLAVIPVITLFIIFQKYYVNNTMGSLKG